MLFSKKKEKEIVEEKQLDLYNVEGVGNRIIVVENGEERDITCSEKIPGIEIMIHGNNNLVCVDLPIQASGNIVTIQNDNARVHIGSTFLFRDVKILCNDGNNQNVDIGTGVTMHNVGIVASEDSEIRIGDGCMFSARVYIYGSDGHAMYDTKTGECINGRKHPTVIGERCWISSDVMVLKNAVIPPNSIIAAASVVTTRFDEDRGGGGNICLAGNPARVVRRNVDWSYESPSVRLERMASKEKNLTLSSSSLQWKCGQKGVLSAYLNECRLPNLQVEWKSLNPEICEVAPEGEIIGKSAGETKVVAAYAGTEAVCEVIVE